MADEDPEVDSEDGEDAPKKDRGPIKMLAGAVGLLAIGGGLAFMAIPSKPEAKPTLQGPLHDQLFEEEFIANTTDASFTRFIKTNPQIEFFAYSPDYVDKRDEDPLYRVWIESDLGALINSQPLSSIIDKEQFAEQVRAKLTPSIFPVHLGNTALPLQVDEESGLRPGDSYRKSTFRGRFHDHVLKIDTTENTLQIDDGPLTVFEGNEIDLPVNSPSGDVIFVDLTELKPDFMGEIPVGVHGRIRQVFITNHLAQ